MAGDFASGSTLSVESVELEQLLPPARFADAGTLDDASAAAAAAGLVRFRDAASGVDTVSTLLPPGARLVSGLSGPRLEFEFLSPLVSPPAKSAAEAPALWRHTVAVALPPPAGADLASASGRVLVVWGGALESEWQQSSVGAALRTAASSFALLPP